MGASYDAIIRESNQQQKISIFQFSKTYPAFIVLFAGIALSFFFWNFVGNKVRSDRTEEFNKASGSVVGRLETEANRSKQVLTSIDGLYKNSVQVVRDMFELYGSIPTRTNNAIQSIYYVPYIAHADKGRFVYYAQSERYYNYSIKSDSNRSYYLPVEYVVPLSQIVNRSGLDFSTVPEADATVKRARDAKGAIVASPFYKVRPDTLGFLMVFKVENKPAESSILGISSGSSEGYVVLEVNADKFFTRAIGENVASDTTIIFQIFDNGTESPIYSSKNAGLLAADISPMFSEFQSIPFADRELRVRFTTVPNFGGKFQSMLPLLSLLIMLILSFVAFGFVVSITTSRARALDLADRLTRSQRRIIEASKDIIAVLDINGNYKTISPAVEQILGCQIDSIIGKNIADLFADAQDKVAFKNRISDAAHGESGVVFDVQMITSTNEIRWLSWNCTVSRIDGNIYATGRDVTLQKIAEEQIRLKNRQVQLSERQAREISEFKSRFMRDLSHKLRNNLTGTLGFLQLLSGKLYNNEEEEQFYIAQAESSSDNLFSVVTDIIDVADESDVKTIAHSEKSRISEVVKDVQEYFVANENGRLISIKSEIETLDISIIADKYSIIECLVEACKALAPKEGNLQIQLTARANPFEKVAEIEILAPYDKNIKKMIDIYKQHSNNLVEALVHDSNDVLFHIGLALSATRQLNGTMMIDSLGEGSENVCMLTLPLSQNKR